MYTVVYGMHTRIVAPSRSMLNTWCVWVPLPVIHNTLVLFFAPTPSTVCKHCTSCARSTHTASSHGSFTARGATKLVVHGVRACGRRRRYGCQPVQISKRKLRCRGHLLGPFKLPSPSLPAAGPRPCTDNISRVPLVCHDDGRSSRTRPQRLDCLHKRRSERRSITAWVQQAACWELYSAC